MPLTVAGVRRQAAAPRDEDGGETSIVARMAEGGAGVARNSRRLIVEFAIVSTKAYQKFYR